MCHFKTLFLTEISFCPDSIGTKLGGKPGSKQGGKKPFKPYNNTEKKSRPWKGKDSGTKEQKFSFSKAGKMSPGKRKLQAVKDNEEEGEGEETSDTTISSVVLFLALRPSYEYPFVTLEFLWFNTKRCDFLCVYGFRSDG